MSEKCPRPVQQCDPQILANASASCPDWSVCLPWGGRLYQVEGCVRYKPGTPPPDGVYGLFTLKDGCFIAAEEHPSDVYHPDPCAPVPCPCDSEGGESTVCNPSTATGNLYTCDASGKPLVKAYINGGNNITVTGTGTSTNPFTISMQSLDTGVANIVSGSNAITVSNDGGTVTIGHKTGYNDQTIMGMTFDEFGHLTNYSAQDASGVTGLVPGDGIKVDVDQSSGIATISLQDPAYVKTGEYTVGGWTMELDRLNRVYNMTRLIEHTAGTLVWGQYNVTLNDYGSVESFEVLPDPGTCIHGFYTHTNEEIIRRNITFNLRYSSAILVDIQVMAPAGWAEQVQFRVDGSPMANVQVIQEKGSSSSGSEEPGGGSGGTSTASLSPAFIRLIPSGIYQIGQHELTIHSPEGFPLEEVMSVMVRPIQTFDSSTALTAADITD